MVTPIAALENEGVQRIFGVPGEENLDVIESLHRSKIELVVTRHEQAAAFMAATFGRLTGQPGVCLSTLVPGALNFATGAGYALLGAMPMVLITAQKGILTSKQARFQIVDIVSSMTPRRSLYLNLNSRRRPCSIRLSRFILVGATHSPSTGSSRVLQRLRTLNRTPA